MNGHKEDEPAAIPQEAPDRDMSKEEVAEDVDEEMDTVTTVSSTINPLTNNISNIKMMATPPNNSGCSRHSNTTEPLEMLLDSAHPTGNIMPPPGSNNSLDTIPLDIHTPPRTYKPPMVDIEGHEDPICGAKVNQDDQHDS